jgi:hypothetical protein
MARLSAPWQVACTTTLRAKPRWSRSANSWALLASQGCTCARGRRGTRARAEHVAVRVHAPAGSLKRGWLGPSYQSSQPGFGEVARWVAHGRSFVRQSMYEAGAASGSRILYMSRPSTPLASLARFRLRRLRALRRGQGLGGAGGGHADHAVVVGHDHVARGDQHAGADDGDVDRAQRGLDGALGADGLLQTGKSISCSVFTSRTPASMISARRAPGSWWPAGRRSSRRCIRR